MQFWLSNVSYDRWSTNMSVRSSHINRKISNESFVLTRECKNIVEETLIEQGLEKLSNLDNYLYVSPIQFISWLIHGRASMLWLDTQGTIDMITSTLESLNSKLVAEQHIVVHQADHILSTEALTTRDLHETLLLFYKLHASLDKQGQKTFDVSEIEWLTMKPTMVLKYVIYSLRWHKNGRLIDTDFSSKYPWWTAKFLNHLSLQESFIPKLQIQAIVSGKSGWEAKTKRLLQACKLIKFYLSQEKNVK